MEFEDIRERCLAKPGVTEGFPFGEEVLVFKVSGKMFLLTRLDQFPVSFNAKCDPERAIELREEFEGVAPGYHMNKNHWNTISFEGSVSDELAGELIDHSYQLVFDKLPKKTRTAILDE